MASSGGTTTLTSLSWNPNLPCLLLRYPNATILLDCAVDLSSLNHFLPFTYTESPRLKDLGVFNKKYPFIKELKCGEDGGGGGSICLIDSIPEVHPVPVSRPQTADFLLDLLNAVSMESVDAILISNWHSLVALPYFTQNTGFKGAVYATDPTLQFGRLVVEELIEYFARIVNEVPKDSWKVDDGLIQSFPSPITRKPVEWRHFYDAQAVEAALDRITLMAYKQTVCVAGSVNITASCSGYAIGSCNWTLSTPFDKIGYMSASALRQTHVKNIELNKLRRLDRLIVTSLAVGAQPPDVSMNQLVVTLAETLKTGGNVLLPVQPTGTVFELLEHVAKQMDAHGVSLDVPIYFVSPVAKKSLAFANVNAEWLSETKQNNVYVPEEPFIHSFLLKNGRLKLYDSLYGPFSKEFRPPAVVFAGHPSLRIGDAAHLLEMWGANKKNAIILTDPAFPIHEVYGPFQDLAIRAFYCPIDTRLDPQQLNSATLPDLRPSVVYVPDAYGKRGGLSMIQYSHASFRYEETVNISNRMRRKRVRIHPELVKQLQLEGDGRNLDTGFGSIRGTLCAYDNAFEIVPAKQSAPVRPRYCGKLTNEALVKAFTEKKIKAEVKKHEKRADTIETENPCSSITLLDGGMKSKVEAKASDRQAILDIIGSCLSPL